MKVKVTGEPIVDFKAGEIYRSRVIIRSAASLNGEYQYVLMTAGSDRTGVNVQTGVLQSNLRRLDWVHISDAVLAINA